jgi:hypothetical protein
MHSDASFYTMQTCQMLTVYYKIAYLNFSSGTWLRKLGGFMHNFSFARPISHFEEYVFFA